MDRRSAAAAALTRPRASSDSKRAHERHAPHKLGAGPRRDLDVGSRAHYTDAAYYTKTYASRLADAAFYVALAEAHGGPVLEYGTGNGRIALPIARHGVEVTGVDLSKAMLDDFRDRLSREPAEVRRRVSLRRGDMRTVRLGRRFPLVFAAFNTMLHLYDRRDFERFFARVREHLTPRGRFVFDVSVPAAWEQVRKPERAYHAPRLRHPTTGELVKYAERFDHDPVRQVMMVMIEFTPVDAPSRAFTTPLAHRQLYPLETEALLHYNGFEIESVTGDFQGGPPARDSDLLVFTCRLARGGGRRREA